jgi:methylenetetrahydrofolate reductase (NADPH)
MGPLNHMNTNTRANPNRLHLSFEFFPPKTTEGGEKLARAQALLQTLNPAFFSVTYGAGGTTRDRTLALVLRTQQLTKVSTAPHLSCVGDDPTILAELIYSYQKEGIERIVALRGDLPSGSGLASSHLRYASDLVRFIRETTGDHFHLHVACYPETHPESQHAEEDLAHFKVKVQAGANSAITQYFYNVEAYEDFLNRATQQGIDIPIYPGIMPITHFDNIVRFSARCGAEVPRWMIQRFADKKLDAETARLLGEEIVTKLCERLLALKVPGLHFYTLNQAEPSLTILQNLRLA